jgi:hypothetical protein
MLILSILIASSHYKSDHEIYTNISQDIIEPGASEENQEKVVSVKDKENKAYFKSIISIRLT